MSKERFEIFGKIIKDNEAVPNLLDNYLATVRLNEFNEKIKDLQLQLDQANEKINEHNEYFKAFNCKDFKEFQDFISSFMLTPHEEQTLIKDLQNQLNQANERLKGAIVPKFKIGQEVFIVNTDYYYEKDYKVEKHKIVGIEDKFDRKNTYVRWYSLEFKDCLTSYSKRYKFLEKNVFATETEAQAKLQELRGGE